MNDTAQRTARSSVLLAVLLVFFLGGIQPAIAGWPLPSWGDGVAFGQRYTAEDGRVLTHGGLDIAAVAGSHVLAPLSGTVAFVGRVPAGEGATQLAISLLLDTGETLSLMPFDEVAAERGARVSEGGLLGTLAAKGDRSSVEQHLHVGLRRGSLYLDPLTVLSPPALGHESVPEPETANEAVVQPAITVPAPAPETASAPSPKAETAVTLETTPITAPASDCAQARSLNRIPEIAPSVSGHASDFLSAPTYGGDVKLLEGIKRVLGLRVSPGAVLFTVLYSLTGLLACFGAVRAMARSTTSDEAPNDTPARKVAAAAGRW